MECSYLKGLIVIIKWFVYEEPLALCLVHGKCLGLLVGFLLGECAQTLSKQWREGERRLLVSCIFLVNSNCNLLANLQSPFLMGWEWGLSPSRYLQVLGTPC